MGPLERIMLPEDMMATKLPRARTLKRRAQPLPGGHLAAQSRRSSSVVSLGRHYKCPRRLEMELVSSPLSLQDECCCCCSASRREAPAVSLGLRRKQRRKQPRQDWSPCLVPRAKVVWLGLAPELKPPKPLPLLPLSESVWHAVNFGPRAS